MLSWLVCLMVFGPWLGAAVVWRLDAKKPTTQNTVAALAALLAGGAALAALPLACETAAFRVALGSVYGDFSLVPDGLGLLLTLIATLIGSLCLWFSRAYMHGQPQLGRYYTLILLFIGAMSGLVLSGSLLFTFIFWELTALCSYALIAFENDDPRAVAGGLKALFITQVGGVGLLVGALLTYTYLGTYEISALLARAATLPPTILATLAFALLIAAAAKSAQFPFHTWLPDAMEAPTPVSALIHAATMVNAGIYLLARFYPAFQVVPYWRETVMVLGVASLLLGALAATCADDLKRVLAYSTISQLGYLVYAVGAGAIFASQFHLLSHALFKALLFLSAGAVIHMVGTRDMRAMGGLGKQLPLVRNAFLIGALGLAGLPPANGFLSKELLLEEALVAGPTWAYAIALLGAGLTALYITRAAYLVFWAVPRQARALHPPPLVMRLVLSVLAVAVLTSWLLLVPISDLLAHTLPFHPLHAMTFGETFSALAIAPATYWTLAVIGLGGGAWLARERLAPAVVFFRPIANVAANGLGLETLNQFVVTLMQSLAATLRYTQTGMLNWNVAGMMFGLACLLAFLALGGGR